ncbi:MAG TPA: AmmeMemoRadiSam system radical SAM enzyme [Spirochaetia bacterium]|nr:AmmeMemoRadiSam system radical SAM enzyme [Spirochaetia bacterium]
MYFKKSEDGKIQCLLCPHTCVIAPDRHGRCRVRFNRRGELDLPYYGKLSAVSVDPIEKKPLYHFHPGSPILSVGFFGCSFRCPFCQNYDISQKTDSSIRSTSPETLVDLAEQKNSFGIAYTYSEPLIHYEYVLETAVLARRRGLKNVLVSNGFINPGPAEELLDNLDAANIDLKTFDPEFYSREIGGELEAVKRFLRQAAGRIHIEVTTLVIPTKNDSEKEIEEMARFISDISPTIPYHLSCYYPTYKYSIPATEPGTVRRLAEAARRHLTFVYLGNVGFEGSNTYCPSCSNLLIRRMGYSTRVLGIERGQCIQCHSPMDIPGT